MLDGIKTTFSISDLAELTGISVHSIRMWERRYAILEPLRTESNIRRYDNDQVKKLLNISTLLSAGFKISELAELSNEELGIRVNASLGQRKNFEHDFAQWKMAMLNFDTPLFEETYHKLLATMNFHDLFLKVVIPFLERIGTLWQTNSITVAHEHFISNLIRQKLFSQLEQLPAPKVNSTSRYILFLPLYELHELGLLFLHYVLRLHGKESIYLGPNVDASTLEGIPFDKHRVFIAYMTFSPAPDEVPGFIKDIRSSILKKDDVLLCAGARVQGVKMHSSWKNVFLFRQLKEILEHLKF